MALDSLTIIGLILGVLGLFGMSMIYKLSKSIWRKLSSRIWPRRDREQLEEVLPVYMTSTTTQWAPALAPMPTTGHSDRLGTMNSASPLHVSPPGGDIQYGASSTAVFSSSSSSYSSLSALNRRHGPMAPTSPVSVQPSTLAINTVDPQPVPPSVQVVVIPETTANQSTTVPKVQRTVLNATQGRTDDVEALGHNDLARLPQENSTHTLTEATSSALSLLNAGASASSSNPSNPPVGTPVGSALPCRAIEGVQEDTCEIETQGALLSNAGHVTAAPQSQLLPEPQEAPDRTTSTSSTRLLEGVTATTDSTSSGTSAAAETSPSSESSMSDQPGQLHALSLRDGRMRPLENFPTEDEAGPVVLSTQLKEVSPDRGPTTGGVRIIILGKNFPSGQLYARFGEFITCTTRWSEEVLQCILPPASRPGIVKVTLSQAPSRNAPEFGQSFAHFEYEDSRILTLSSLLKMIPERLDGTPLENVLTSVQQYLAGAMGPSTDPNVHTSMGHVEGLGAHRRFQELEKFSIRFLSAYSRATNWNQIISLRDTFGQTMAHIAVMLGYFQLLGSLVEWGIDLNLTDSKGSTALHYAFLCNEFSCAVLLIRSGADELALDELGRSPWDLNPFLVLKITPQLRGLPKIDGSLSVSCHPAEEEWQETEPPREDGELKADRRLLVTNWLLQTFEEPRTEEEQCTEEEQPKTLNDEDIPRHHTPTLHAAPCYPEYRGAAAASQPASRSRSFARGSRGDRPLLPRSSEVSPSNSQQTLSEAPSYEYRRQLRALRTSHLLALERRVSILERENMILRQSANVQPSMRYSLYDDHPNEVKKGTTLAQIKVLEEQFRATDKPDAATRGELSTRLGMTPHEVQVWFQNRRAKEKRLRIQAPSILERDPLLISPYSNFRNCSEAPQLMNRPTSAPAMADCSPNTPAAVRNTQNKARRKSHQMIPVQCTGMFIYARYLGDVMRQLEDSTLTTSLHSSLVPLQRCLLQLSTAKQMHRTSASSPAFTPQDRGCQNPVLRSSQLTIIHLGLPRHRFTPMRTRPIMPLAPGVPSSSAPVPQAPAPPLTRTPANDHHAVTMLLKPPVISPPWCVADAFMSIFNYPGCPDLQPPSTCSVSRGIWYYHHPSTNAFSSVSELKLMRRPIVPTHHLSPSSPSKRPVHRYPDGSYLVGILNRVASSDDHVNSTTLASMPLVIAIDGEDSIEYSRHIAGAAGAPPTIMAGLVESAGEDNRVPRTSAQLCHPLRHTFTSDASPAIPGGNTSLQSALSTGCPSSASPPAEAEAILESGIAAEALEDLRKSAPWPCLRKAALLDPVIGAVESDPAEAADRLGVKGLSVYTSFIEMESLQCRVCGDQSTQLRRAVLHQRHQRHFQQ